MNNNEIFQNLLGSFSETGDIVNYELITNQKSYDIASFLDKHLCIEFTGEMFCIGCENKIKKSYQGYCFLCTQRLAACDLCILQPVRCHYHLGTCRQPSWGEANCFIPHVVYLTNTSGLKVGLAREFRVDTRWIEQGASQGMILYRVKSRRFAGIIESELAKHISDKTNFRVMLKNGSDKIDLVEKSLEVKKLFNKSISTINEKYNLTDFNYEDVLPDNANYREISYPIISYPDKIKSVKLSSELPSISGKLIGIKGKYLIFDNAVINTRNLNGYSIKISG